SNDNSVAMMKKLLVSLLSALLCISVVAEPEIQSDGNQNGSDVKIDEKGDVFVSPLKYHISSDSTAEVIYDRSYIDLESVVIPSEIRIAGYVYPVTSIEYRAFYGCYDMTNIEIPSSVTHIDISAFDYCTELTSINVSRDNSNYSSEDGILYNKNKTELICVPMCKKGKIRIPSSVISISDSAFDGCKDLTNIKVSFNNSVFSSKHGILYYEDIVLYKVPMGRRGNVRIQSGVTSIYYGAFEDCKDLTNIKIPSSVTSIWGYAFSGCSGLTSIEIPSSVTSIGNEAFSDCRSLTDIKIPSSVISIRNNVFENCVGLTSIEIPSSVTSIGNEAFSDCRSLTDIKIPSSVISIGHYAFFGCYALKNIEIPSSVTSIGNNAFGGIHDGSKVIKIPASACIGEGAFKYWGDLTIINVSTDNAIYSSMDGVLYDKNKTELICVPLAMNGKFDVPSGVTNIGVGAFSLCMGLTSIKIPSSVTSIGDYAFNGCSGLTNIKIPSGVTSIGSRAFMDCENFEIVIDNSKKNVTVGEDAFKNCKSVKFLK
ncbi:MAG: leucine-rich repeat domain-containing protein, partial [Paludibacteraceae bacterium]|nr:leucine-rich repeat domain-containing protein [Paludibacteraceae bacterium]